MQIFFFEIRHIFNKTVQIQYFRKYKYFSKIVGARLPKANLQFEMYEN